MDLRKADLADQIAICDVPDALCKLKHPKGGFMPGFTKWSPERRSGETKVVGPAYTVKYVALDDLAPNTATSYVSESRNPQLLGSHISR